METVIRVTAANGRQMLEYVVEDWQVLLNYFEQCDAIKWEPVGVPKGEKHFMVSRSSFLTSIRQVLNWLERDVEESTERKDTWKRMLGLLREASVNLSRCNCDVVSIELIEAGDQSGRSMLGSIL